MEKRRLGGSKPTMGPSGFGGNVFGWTVPEKAAFAVLGAGNIAALDRANAGVGDGS